MFGLDVAASVSTIVGLAIVVIGGVLYGIGVLRSPKVDARWQATKHDKLGKVVFVKATLKSRTRNKQTVTDAGLVQDPGWPRRLRGRFSDLGLKRFNSSSVSSGLSIDGHDAAELKAERAGEALPYDKTRLWIKQGKRNFYFKLKNW